MSDYDDMHGHPRRVHHVILVSSDNLTDEQIEQGIVCLIGHAIRGHGLHPISLSEAMRVMANPNFAEEVLDSIARFSEMAEMDLFGVGVRIPPPEDEILH